MGAAASTGIGDSHSEPDLNLPSAAASHGSSDSACCSEQASFAHQGNDYGASASDGQSSDTRFDSAKKPSFDNLPDDVLIKILAAVSSSAEKPADVVAPAMTCRRWRLANNDREVRRRVSRGGIGVRPTHWGEGALWFLRRLCDAGCLEACFMLGMILAYCIPGGHLDGGRLLLHSAKAGHAASLHNLGIMSFNGSGFGAGSKDFRTGLALCTRAAALGNAEAMREVGLCLLDGFGVKQSHVDGWRLLLKAQLAEMGVSEESQAAGGPQSKGLKRTLINFDEGSASSSKRRRSDVFGNSVRISNKEQEAAVSGLMDMPVTAKSGVGSSVAASASSILNLLRAAKPSTLPGLRPVLEQLEAPLVDIPVHPAHAFIAEWFQDVDDGKEVQETVDLTGKGVPMLTSAMAGKCSSPGCARREMRPLEFWRCASCWSTRYCSRACQVKDWRSCHSQVCKRLVAPDV